MLNKVSNLAFVCSVLVVSIHIGITDEPFRLGWCMKELLAEGFARIAVPFFFLASGYFVARKYAGREDVFRVGIAEVRKRIHTLLIPFWFWGLLYLPCLIGCWLVSDWAAGRPLRTIDWLSVLLRTMGIDFVGIPVMGPLWYVRVLFVLVVVSPFLVLLIRRIGIFWPLLAFLFYVVAEFSDVHFPGIIYDGKGIAYFSIGMYCAQCGSQDRVSRALLQWRVAGPIGICSICATIMVKLNGLEFAYMSLLIPGMLLLSWKCIPDVVWPRWLTSLSFPIYLLHCYWLLPVQYAWHLTSWMPKGCEFAFRLIVVLAGSSITALMMRRFAPVVSKIAFGGR